MKSLWMLALVPVMAGAQATIATEFPTGADPIVAEKLRQFVSGKVWVGKTVDGSRWRLEYRDNGYVFIDVSTGFRDNGTWRTEDSRLCAELQRVTAGCSEVRVVGERLYMKRVSNGEVLALVAN